MKICPQCRRTFVDTCETCNVCGGFLELYERRQEYDSARLVKSYEEYEKEHPPQNKYARKIAGFIEWLKVFSFIPVLFIVLPAVITGAHNLFHQVIMGDLTLSAFMGKWPQYTYGPVFDFYYQRTEFLRHIWFKLTH